MQYPLAEGLLKTAGLKVVHAVKEDFFMLTPESLEEHARYGTLTISRRAMAAMEKQLEEMVSTVAR